MPLCLMLSCVRNLEFKARVDDSRALLAKARGLGAELWGDLRQTDTYSVPSTAA